ncbi:MAG: OadG family protein [Faecalibacterium sp.]|nr:OadG family protein [Faecalibacterium sp.]
MSNFFAPVLLAIEPQPSDLVVTLTGMALVFAILVILMLIITLEGKFFDSMNARKQEKRDAQVKAAAASKAAPAAKPVESAAPTAPAPVVEQGIPAEIVAVIAAAIAAMGNGKYVLKAVSRAGKGKAWGRAGVNDVTSPF